jgi:methionyl-tRNA formyltransferase
MEDMRVPSETTLGAVHPPVVAFFGNRYGPLSHEFFKALDTYRTGVGFNWPLVLVDTSTAHQAALKTRLRNAVVHYGKAVLRVSTETSNLDWFRTAAARRYVQLTPAAHRIADPGLAQSLRTRNVFLVLVAGCDQILKKQLIQSVPRIVNFHNSRLPNYAGCAAVEWAFVNREPEVGYTFHTIDSEKIDQGRVVFQRSIAVREGEGPRAFAKRLIADAVAHLPVVLDICLAHPWPPAESWPLDKVTYFPARRAVEHARLDLALPTSELMRRVRIWGGLDLGHPTTRLVATALAEPRADVRPSTPIGRPGDWLLGRAGLSVVTKHGLVLITRINHLWAPALIPILPPRLGYLEGKRLG